MSEIYILGVCYTYTTGLIALPDIYVQARDIYVQARGLQARAYISGKAQVPVV